MQITFTDLQGERIRGVLAGRGQVGMVEVLLVNARGRGYVVEDSTRCEFSKKKGRTVAVR
ncbi:MAG: hypothetical protein M0Z66_05740 [Thermaerobacter sp.]|nr:hypothetical protein [Thermaerobacter sp.]